MSNDQYYRSAQDFETHIQNKIQAEKEGRQEVSNGHYASIAITMFVIVGCLAAQNGYYGYSQGSTYAAMVLLAVMYFAGDWALAALTSLSTRQHSANALSFLAKAGLVLLSVTSGVSFMIGEQHQNDVSHSRVASLERQIETNEQAFSQYHKTITAERLERLNTELRAERARVGANHASSNAVYMYLAKMTGYPFEVVSFAVRTLWVVVFIVTGMALSTLLGLLWCPWKEAKAHSRIMSQQRAHLRRAKAQTKLLQQYADIEEWRVGNRSPKSQVRTTPRAPTQDTDTTGETSVRYKVVRNKVLTGEVRPSVGSLKQLGMGPSTAQGYLRQLVREKVIQKEGQGYVLAQ